MHDESAAATMRERVHILFNAGTTAGLTDRDLLERFLDHGGTSGEAAFCALIERHGPLVLRVCNQVLMDRHAAEDAFQTTFLVLARRARSIRKHGSLQSWLFGVAIRAAARIRMLEARRQRHERRGTTLRGHSELLETDSSEHWPELHAAIARLPEKYRVPILLCYFEGLTHEQTADRLGWPVGTVKTRLSRAREQLRWRLERYHCRSALLILNEPGRASAVEHVPRMLADLTATAATRFLSGARAGGFISPDVVALTQGVLRAMVIGQIRLSAITSIALMAIGVGAVVYARQTAGDRRVDGQPLLTNTATQEPPAAADGQAPKVANPEREPFRSAVDGQPGPASDPVKDAPRPTILRLNGSTSYAPYALTAVNMPLDGRIETVVADLGSTVKEGDALMTLSSSDLAAYKSRFVSEFAEWNRLREALEKEPKGPGDRRKKLRDDEFSTRLSVEALKGMLTDYGLTTEDVVRAASETDARKAELNLRSPVAGVVIERSAVRGNFYESMDKLLVIAQDERLQVSAEIDLHDADFVAVGQRMTIRFPFSERAEVAKVEAVNPSQVPRTGKVTVRSSIPNPDHRLKPGMSVAVRLELGPAAQSAKASPARVLGKSDTRLDERLNEIERKLARLLDEKDGPSTNAKILERLSELEKKVDRALNLKSAK
jgi:RNA polymerase sigma factor (sigma-70 family)